MADQQTGFNPTQWIATNEAADLAGCTSCLPKRKLTRGITRKPAIIAKLATTCHSRSTWRSGAGEGV
jgi:hypothetical protein